MSPLGQLKQFCACSTIVLFRGAAGSVVYSGKFTGCRLQSATGRSPKRHRKLVDLTYVHKVVNFTRWCNHFSIHTATMAFAVAMASVFVCGVHSFTVDDSGVPSSTHLRAEWVLSHSHTFAY